MSRPRRRLFGPLLYSTLAVGLLVGAYTAIMRVGQMLEQYANVRALAAGLTAGDPQARASAARALMSHGPAVFMPILREAARDPRGEVRALACRFLVEGWSDPSESIPLLITAAGDEREDVRIEVARGLGQVARYRSLVRGVQSLSTTPGGLPPGLRDDALRTVRRLLKDSSRAIRTEAAGALGEFGPDPAVTADLIAAAGDDDRMVRLAAARALVKINGPEDRTAARTLIAMVAGTDAVADRSEVLQAAKTMSEAVQDQAVAALVGLLSHGDPVIVPDVLACLPEAGPRATAALPVLEAMLDDAEPSLRAGAAMAIVAIEGQDNLRPLRSGASAGMSMGGSGSVGMGGGAGMASPVAEGHENPRVVAVLLRIVVDAEVQEDMRLNALAMIRAFGAPALAKATPDLVRQLSDRDPNVRRTALQLLSGIIDDVPAELPAASMAR
jgi:HEAT repeat protein